MNKNNYYNNQPTTKKLISNCYVHSGFYNFENNLKVYDKYTNSFNSQLTKQLKSDFSQSIMKAQRREAEILSLSNTDDLQNYLTYGQMAEQVIQNLDIYKIIDDIISQYSDKSTNRKVSIDNIGKKIEKNISYQIDSLALQLGDSYSTVLNSFKGEIKKYNFLKALNKNKEILSSIKNKKGNYFNLSNYQSILGEFATVVDQISKGALERQLSYSFSTSNNKTKKNKIDFQSNEINFSILSKNYKDYSKGIGIKTGHLQDFLETNTLLLGQELKLENFFRDNGINMADFQDYLYYLIINTKAFSAVGGYLTAKDKKEGNLQKINNSSSLNLVYDLVKFLSAYWLGSQIINSINEKETAFIYLGDKVVPVSKILTAIEYELGRNVYSIKVNFSNFPAFDPKLMRQQKYKVMRKLNKRVGWNNKRMYPEELLKIGSSVGKNAIERMKFSIELNLKNIDI